MSNNSMVQLSDDDILVEEESSSHNSTDLGEGPVDILPSTKKLKTNDSATCKSSVWKYFKYDTGRHRSICQLCCKDYNGKCPSNLQKHLKKMHQELFSQIRETFMKPKTAAENTPNKLRQASIEGHVTKLPSNLLARKYDSNSAKYLSLRKKMALHFAANSIPYSVAETTEFIDFITELDCQFTPPGRRTVSRDVVQLTAEIKSATEIAITDANQLTAVLDIWSRLSITESYLGIKLQFFDFKIGKIQHALLALEKLEGKHTADNVFTTFCHVLDQWNIPFSKINYFVTDNGSNMIKALRDVIDDYKINAPEIDDRDFDDTEIDESELLLEGDQNLEKSFVQEIADFDECEIAHNTIFGLQKRIPCMAHRLVCVLRRYVDNCASLKSIISGAFSLIRTFTKSPNNMKDLLSDAANERHIKLLSPCRTRWIYLYYTFKRLIDLRLAVENVVVENNLINVALSPLQWKQIEQIVSLLEPFAQVVNELEGEKYATLSQVIPTLYDLLDQLSADDVGGVAAIISIKQRLRCDLEKTFDYILNPDAEKFQPIFTVATFFEPKFITGLSERQIKVAINEIQRQIQKENDATTSSLPLSEDALPTRKISAGRFSGFFKRSTPALISAQSIISKSFASQIHVYIDEANKLNFSSKLVEESMETINGIDFWCAQKDGLLKSIAEFALQVLAIPATSAGIERVFSQAGFIFEKRRYRLNSLSLENELFVKINHKFLNH